MDRKKIFLKILHSGLLEIRFLSTQKKADRRINRLANILHNIPRAILDDSDFDFNLLKRELSHYQKEYKNSTIDYKPILDQF